MTVNPTQRFEAVVVAVVLSLGTGCRTAAPGVAVDTPQRYLTPEGGHSWSRTRSPAESSLWWKRSYETMDL